MSDIKEVPEERPVGRITKVDIVEEMKSCYIDYSMSVIVGRALPDVRDGFKPVHRRVLYGMKELGVEHTKPYKKAARIVGQVMGLYHPHGDSSIYGTLVRMAQPWALNHTLVDGQGNYGSVDGDPAAAMRYTEARLTKLATLMFREINMDTVDWIPTYDDSGLEPSVLPVAFPQLLVNGTTGIAVGMGTNILPHNLREVIAATIAIIDNPEISDEEVLSIIPAPDFPTGGIIHGLNTVRPGMLNGQGGRTTVRAEYVIENDGKKEMIVFTSMPYNVSTDDVTIRIAELVKDEVIEGIHDISNESNKDGIRLTVTLDKNATVAVVASHLYKHTNLQVHYPINNTVLVNSRPKVLSVMDMIKEWIKFRYEVTKKRILFELGELSRRLELLNGYIAVLSSIDKAIRIIKKSESPTVAREELMKAFKINDVQAKAVLELKLSKLTSLEIVAIQNERTEVMEKHKNLTTILNSDPLLYNDIKSHLVAISNEFGVDRRCKIEMSDLDVNMEEFIEKKDVIITVSDVGYVKRTTADAYRTQSRGGQGKMIAKMKQDDTVKSVFYCNTHSFLFAITDKGRCYYTKAYNIPEGERMFKGRPIQNFLDIKQDETIVSMATSDTFDDKLLFVCTKNGVGKKMDLSAVINGKRRGVNAVNIEDGDDLMGALILNQNDTVLVADSDGQVIRFHHSAFRTMGRNASGNKVMDTKNKLVSMIMCGDDDKFLVTVSTNGLGKKTAISQYRIMDRYYKGVSTMKCTDRTGELLGIMLGTNDDDIMITCKSGKSIRFSIGDVREIGRDTQGVILMDKTEGDDIVDFIIISSSVE